MSSVFFNTEKSTSENPGIEILAAAFGPVLTLRRILKRRSVKPLCYAVDDLVRNARIRD